MKNKLFFNSIKTACLTLYIVIFSFKSNAQCAMCKAGAEQSLENGATDANWINYGILGLMSVPLILIFLLYRLYRINNLETK